MMTGPLRNRSLKSETYSVALMILVYSVCCCWLLTVHVGCPERNVCATENEGAEVSKDMSYRIHRCGVVARVVGGIVTAVRQSGTVAGND